jgi:hypothetical protein
MSRGRACCPDVTRTRVLLVEAREDLEIDHQIELAPQVV